MNDDRVGAALDRLAAGRPVVVVDDPDRENECDVVFPASLATPELVAFTVRHSSGILCAPMPGADADRLALPPMTAVSEDPKGTAFTVSVDARNGVTTGISAADRARTLRVLADTDAAAGSLTRPGHVFPLRAREGGVLARRGHTEAGVELLRLAGLPRVAGIAELVGDDGSMLRAGRLPAFLDAHDLVALTVQELAEYVRRHERQVRRVAVTRLPTVHGAFTAYGYLDEPTGIECVLLVAGDLCDGEDVLVRVHSECLTGDAFGSARCDCGAQLDSALAQVSAAGRGVVAYVRGHEGRGIGLLSKLRAYELQDAGADTVEANLRLGLPVDSRDYAPAVQALLDVGVRSVRLITNNPAKEDALRRSGVVVRGRVPSHTAPTADNLHYLRVKRDRMGHDVPWLGEPLLDAR
ncbi:MAG: GTP cyclohydrolase II [Streptosporangiales bacterium]|nr:GTP cyclohydrolase II [Streptosporangiales bacterium]